MSSGKFITYNRRTGERHGISIAAVARIGVDKGNIVQVEDSPFGQIEAQPLRVHDEHGTFLSHFNLRLW
jgi:hypothetical protein